MNFTRMLFPLVTLGWIGLSGSAWAQDAATGPVHFPASTPTPSPSPALVAATPTNGPLQFPASSPTSTPAATVAPSIAPIVANTAATAEDIHDIRGPITIPYAWQWVIYIVSALALAGVLYALWSWLHRQPAVKPKSPFEIALDRLEEARPLMTEGTVREYAFTVSEIIRVYIEQRFGEKAAHRTTEEFLSDLVRQTGTPLASHRDRLEDFLNYCDLPKFARWQLSTAEMESMHESARVFILDTRPQPEPAKQSKSVTGVQPELLEAK
jgi:hypothetical protein